MKKIVVFIFTNLILLSAYALAAPIPDTGQTKCYDNTHEIPFPQPEEPFYGQDAHYTINWPSYKKLDASGYDLSDNASSWSMVSDNVTGLTWENKIDDGSIHDKDSTYTWENAQNVFISQLNADFFGGYNDWRLPTIQELPLIMDLGAFNP